MPGPIVGAPGPQTAAAICAGADLPGNVYYVSAQGTESPLCGQSTAQACKTIQQAIYICDIFLCRAVLVRHGLYQTTATINVRDRMSIYGGCLFDGEPDRKYRTVIQASPAPGTPAISASGINDGATVYGLVVIGKDETANGAASIAMAVSDSTALALSHTVLASGKGGDGPVPVVPPAPNVAVGGGSDQCFTPGGPASGLIWGAAIAKGTTWLPSFGGAGAQGNLGAGGAGGQQGGASIALLLSNSTAAGAATTNDNRIVAGLAGNGGAGQQGASFGLGGGAGSGGAGGNGGPSIGLALRGDSPAPPGLQLSPE